MTYTFVSNKGYESTRSLFIIKNDVIYFDDSDWIVESSNCIGDSTIQFVLIRIDMEMKVSLNARMDGHYWKFNPDLSIDHDSSVDHKAELIDAIDKYKSQSIKIEINYDNVYRDLEI